jgi:hypothetical protein
MFPGAMRGEELKETVGYPTTRLDKKRYLVCLADSIEVK